MLLQLNDLSTEHLETIRKGGTFQIVVEGKQCIVECEPEFKNIRIKPLTVEKDSNAK